MNKTREWIEKNVIKMQIIDEKIYIYVEIIKIY